jgi:hypothetical protein
MTTPVPTGRGRWRFFLFQRAFSDVSDWSTLVIAELTGARSRRLVQVLNGAAEMTLTLDGRDQAAAMVAELATDLVAFRWDEASGTDLPMFRGPVTQSEDQVSEQAHTVNLTAWDYFKMLSRRFTTLAYTATQQDQDVIVRDLYNIGVGATSSMGGTFPPSGAPVALTPGSYLPMQPAYVKPDGTGRAFGAGVLRDRAYPPQTQLDTALDDLAHVLGGFDYDVLAFSGNVMGGSTRYDALRVWYPVRGITRTTPELVYGASVSSLTRTVTSADYGNYWRVVGNNQSSNATDPQRFSETWNPDAASGSAGSPGLWMSADNAPDVTIQTTLDQQVQGDLNYYGTLTPTYALVLRPGFYAYGAPNIGDVVPLFVRSGRLDVQASVRVVGITYDVGDDGNEDVTLTVGRPPVGFAQILRGPVRDIDALVRR